MTPANRWWEGTSLCQQDHKERCKLLNRGLLHSIEWVDLRGRARRPDTWVHRSIAWWLDLFASNHSNNNLTKSQQFIFMLSLTCTTTGIRQYCDVRVSTGTTGEAWPFEVQCKDTCLTIDTSERSESAHDWNVLVAPIQLTLGYAWVYVSMAFAACITASKLRAILSPKLTALSLCDCAQVWGAGSFRCSQLNGSSPFGGVTVIIGSHLWSIWLITQIRWASQLQRKFDPAWLGRFRIITGGHS